CADFMTDPLFTNLAGWNSPVSSAGDPTIISRSLHVQPVNQSTTFMKGMTYTTNLSTSWLQYVTFPEDRLPRTRLSQPGGIPVIYQGIRTSMTSSGRNIDKLVRITRNAAGPTAFATYPAMNNFGGLGINPTMFAWYEVFGVDPGNSQHLIAPDLINEKMM